VGGDVTKPLVLAFYLPQYHPEPLNDTHWGPGFSEWTSLAASRYRRHLRLPGELGFYDLRLHETRAAQAELARSHGVDGFCYWHYWFEGRRALDRVFDEVRASGEPDFPFCLGWANESWTGTWVGRSRRVIIEQTYSEDDHREHMQHLCTAFADPRYLRIDGRPLLYVYRPLSVPEPRRWRGIWDEVARSAGEARPFLVGEVRSDRSAGSLLDAGVLDAVTVVSWDHAFGRLQRFRRRLRAWPMSLPYERAARRLSLDFAAVPKALPTVLTGWNNTPRYGRRGVVLTDYTPEAFGRVLDVALADFNGPVLFLKSWNEWAEGNALEPDREHGRGHLEALADRVRARRA
jgi:hypothetical protein